MKERLPHYKEDRDKFGEIYDRYSPGIAMFDERIKRDGYIVERDDKGVPETTLVPEEPVIATLPSMRITLTIRMDHESQEKFEETLSRLSDLRKYGGTPSEILPLEVLDDLIQFSTQQYYLGTFSHIPDPDKGLTLNIHTIIP